MAAGSVMANPVQRVFKGMRFIAERGPHETLREIAYSFYCRRHERWRSRAFANGKSRPKKISLLGNEFELHPSMKGVNETLSLFGVHEPIASAIYSSLLTRGGHVIDVGANIGYFLSLANKAIGGTGKILAFEPVPTNFEILERNIQRIPNHHIRIFPWAIGEKNETAVFYESEIPNWGSLIRNEVLLPTREITVQVSTLDHLMQDFGDFHPTALRMDVDGAELMILSGAKQLLRKFRPLLFIEFHPVTLGQEPINRTLLELQELGYSQGFLVNRMWDHPWIGKWVRQQQCWFGPMESLLTKLGPANRATGVFSLLLKSDQTPHK